MFDVSSFLFPAISPGGKDGLWLSQEERVSWFSQPPLRRCGRFMGSAAIDEAVAGAAYVRVPTLRIALKRLKYRRSRVYVGPLAEVLLRGLSGLALESGSVLCPVPLHWTRRLWRGFNQAELLAQEASLKSGFPMRKILHRRRATGWQSHREDRRDRRTAMVDAFVINPMATLPRHVILIDDVCTSGATLDACAAVLKNAGVRRVDAAVVAFG